MHFGNETVRIDATLAPRIDAYLQTQTAENPPPSLTVSSTTLGTYRLTAQTIVRLK
jgi:hypothetical protein